MRPDELPRFVAGLRAAALSGPLDPIVERRVVGLDDLLVDVPSDSDGTGSAYRPTVAWTGASGE